MTTRIHPYAPRVFVGTIHSPEDQPTPATYRVIATANDHLHKVLNALLKERSGQPLTEAETSLISLHVAAKLWELKHTNKED